MSIQEFLPTFTMTISEDSASLMYFIIFYSGLFTLAFIGLKIFLQIHKLFYAHFSLYNFIADMIFMPLMGIAIYTIFRTAFLVTYYKLLFIAPNKSFPVRIVFKMTESRLLMSGITEIELERYRNEMTKAATPVDVIISNNDNINA